MSPRRKRFRRICSPPVLRGFKPIGVPLNEAGIVSVLFDEYEAIRLVDYESLSHEEAAKIMNVSRPTFTRIYNSCLKKIARGFAEGKSIIIEGGEVEFDKHWFRCNDCHITFHSLENKNPECTNCHSKNTENINKSIRDWRERKFNTNNKIETKEYCICSNCNYKEPHERGIPCFTRTCPDCKMPLVRQDF
ncbi:MAG: DUF134 domain-containing protein [Bacteroidales bacterium]|nr:MAG: DUF134 domain-containing protein [Bacteroidales bacterium]